MSRIEQKFAQLNEQGKKALIPYITGGDPKPEYSVELMHALVAAGADMIELGMPFSDPMADGPVIQKACERALAAGTTLNKVLAMVETFRQTDTDTPVVLMGYLNPIEYMGYQNFATAAKKAGVDGVLTVDLPPEEADELVAVLKAEAIDTIFLIAPTTTALRAAKIANHASGYLYYVSIKGVTGSAALDTEAVAEKVAELQALTSVPVAVGFGIRDGASAAAISKVSDGVIVGSVLVNKIAELSEQPEKIAPALTEVLKEMRSAMDA
ncbi:tryptophan synthase, alpha chain [Oceanospirillum multiglobuliferum]|uniref:Tryptophan synthase alpha chain n=1 Tax=Oceanospirillum multiglobuliferum TaxID=64969 RepID=A0A1T4LL33_9GAMM|nr:tryptophan synthase subunit alpha [Oceanospirillum multiglobuliferum]OPX56626.1 tryptophan synthase subunit alpha [Oceanospirillum multiglobuliferum]SJZ55174.1 tryptophan synthase, alpha chain [Oceanospirillum multiglobuliferum]